MTVTLSHAEAQIAADTIAQYMEDRQLHQRHAAELSALLGTPELEPEPMSAAVRTALEYVLAILRGASREDAMRVHEHELAAIGHELKPPPTREDLGGDARVLSIIARAGDTATVSWIVGELKVLTDEKLSESYVEHWLHDLQADELVRELADGRGNRSWELTEKGHEAR